MRNISTLCAAITLSVLLAACGSGQNVAGSSANATCTSCHGGLDNETGAPPLDAHGLASSAAVGAHTVHLKAGVSCDTCHVVPTAVEFPNHQNGVDDVTLGGRAALNGSSPRWTPSSLTCATTYCHAGKANGTTPTPAWNGSLGAQVCAGCHAPNGTYGAADLGTALHGLHRCAACHGETNASVGCQACHAGYQRQLGTTPPVLNPADHIDGFVQLAGTTVPLLNDRVIHTSYDRTTHSCSSDCHTIPGHGVLNPQTWE